MVWKKQQQPQAGFFSSLFKKNHPEQASREYEKQPSLSMAALLKGNNKYTPIQILGRGAYGVVLMAVRKSDGKKVAIKLLARGKKICDRVLREIKNHKLMDHPNVVKFHEVFLTKMHLCIVMEYAPGKNLLEYVTSKAFMDESEARKVFQQLILAVHYCHEVRVVSRDIKLDNTLIDCSDEPKIKICDFGYSKHMDTDSLPNSQVGTLHYLAPEIYKLRPDQKYDAQKADVWSSGIFLYAILTGNYPFQNNPNTQYGYFQLVERVTKGIFYVPEDDISPEGCDLLKKMINVNTQERISIEEIKDHDWFKVDLPDNFETLWNHKAKQIDDVQKDREIDYLVKKAKSAPVSENRIEAAVNKASSESNSGHEFSSASERDDDSWAISE